MEVLVNSLIATLQQMGITDAKYDRRNNCITSKSRGFNLNLENAYREYSTASGSERSEIVARYARTAAIRHDLPFDFNEAAPYLLPSVRSTDSFKSEVPSIHLVGPFSVGIVYDVPDAMLDVLPQALHNWGKSLAELLDISYANLDKRQATFSLIGDPKLGGCACITDDYAGALALFTGTVTKKVRVNGNVVVAIPNRRNAYVTGDSDASGLHLMRQLLQKDQEAKRAEYPTTALRYVNGLWQMYS